MPLALSVFMKGRFILPVLPARLPVLYCQTLAFDRHLSETGYGYLYMCQNQDKDAWLYRAADLLSALAIQSGSTPHKRLLQCQVPAPRWRLPNDRDQCARPQNPVVPDRVEQG